MISDADFTRLFNDRYNGLKLFAQKMVHNEPAAEDIVLKSFMVFYRKGHHDYSPGLIKNELYLMVKSEAITYLRTKKNAPPHEITPYMEDVLDGGQDADKALIWADFMGELRRQIDSLPKRMREILLLKMKGLHETEIAKILHITRSSVSVHMTLMRKKIHVDFSI